MNIIDKFKFKSIRELMNVFPDEQTCIDFLEGVIWDGNPVSPFDETSKVYKCKDNRYKCRNTGKYFNVRSVGIFKNSNIKLQDWFIAIWLYSSHKGGVSSMQLERELGITQKTAWFILQRLRKCSQFENNHVLSNEIEVDETYIGGKNKNRPLPGGSERSWLRRRRRGGGERVPAPTAEVKVLRRPSSSS